MSKDTDIGIADLVVVMLLTGVALMTPTRAPRPTAKTERERPKRALPPKDPGPKMIRLHVRRAYAARGRRGRNLEGV